MIICLHFCRYSGNNIDIMRQKLYFSKKKEDIYHYNGKNRYLTILDSKLQDNWYSFAAKAVI